jgi:hypothetical protein
MFPKCGDPPGHLATLGFLLFAAVTPSALGFELLLFYLAKSCRF